MKLTLSFEELETSMSTVTSIVSDKLLQEDLKNLIIWVKEGKTRFSAYNGHIISATSVDATVEGVEGEAFVQLKAKEINDIIASFKGLKRTKVSKVEFYIEENKAVMHVFEAPIDEEIDNANEYHQESKFLVTKPRIKEAIKNEIQKINTEVEGSQIDSGDLLLFIQSLYPTVAKETRESTSSVFFGKDHIYTMLSAYSAIMPNKLPEVLSGFKLSNNIVNFLKNFISDSETFLIDKQDMGNGMIILTVKVNGSVAQIKCADMSRAYDITNFVKVPANGIVVDKAYLIDVLKRMNLSSDAANVEVSIENGVGSMKIVAKNMTQNVPIVTARGEGTYNFSIRAELLSSMIFSHMTIFGENVFLYLEQGDKGNIIMAVKDNTELWQTKVTGLAQSKGNFAW